MRIRELKLLLDEFDDDESVMIADRDGRMYEVVDLEKIKFHHKPVVINVE